ncbi:MAG: glycosyltransferase family 4 protein [Candidatus Methanoperedenaceae archaeon]|nr:glycosyltransferase family 4 protein [Candidatus Methanoperedenaceae archaeon]
MKVIQLADGFYPLIGGGSLAIRTWIENMPEVEFEVITNALPGCSLLEKYPFSNNCQIKRFLPEDISHSLIYKGKNRHIYFPYKIFSEWVRFHRKITYIKRSKCDLINFNGPLTNYGFFSFDRLLNRGILTKFNDFRGINQHKVLTLHGIPSEFTDKRTDIENEKRIIEMFDNIICVSPHIKKKVLESIKKDAKKKNIWYLPNSIDIHRFFPLLPEEKIEDKAKLGYFDKFIAVFVGQLTPVKNIDMLLMAWKIVIAQHSNSKLLIIGFGHEKERLEQLSINLELTKNLEFLGKKENVWRYLQISDLFILSSKTEGMSIALLEAMATGLPVISTKVGGSTDVIENGINGILLDSPHHEILAKKIIDLIGNPIFRNRIGINARKTIENEFSSEVIIPRLRKIYSEILNQ